MFKIFMCHMSYFCVHVYVIFVVDQNSAGDEHWAGQTAAQQGTGREGGRDGRTPILHAEKGKLDTRGQNKGTPSVKTSDRLGSLCIKSWP